MPGELITFGITAKNTCRSFDLQVFLFLTPNERKHIAQHKMEIIFINISRQVRIKTSSPVETGGLN